MKELKKSIRQVKKELNHNIKLLYRECNSDLSAAKIAEIKAAIIELRNEVVDMEVSLSLLAKYDD